jgi:N-acetylglutamate synthase-like GNAT family acetyltransferase
MGDIVIRVATTKDRDRVFSLLRSAAMWLRERGIDYWQSWHAPPATHVDWVDSGLAAGEFRMVESEGSVIGCLRLQDSDEYFWGVRPEAARYVHSLTIDRARAGRGIGRRVIRMIEQSAASDGAELLRLDCGVDVGALRAYYESCGFAAVGETTVDGERLVLYEKPVMSA